MSVTKEGVELAGVLQTSVRGYARHLEDEVVPGLEELCAEKLLVWDEGVEDTLCSVNMDLLRESLQATKNYVALLRKVADDSTK